MPVNYTVEFDAAAITNAGGDWDLWELTPADDKPIQIFGLFLYVTSELQEAQEEWLRYRVIRGHTTSGSTPISTPTPQPIASSADRAAGFTAECNNSTIASAGTAANLHSGAFNVRAGEPFWLPEGSEWGCTQANTTIVVRLMSTVADDVTMTGTLYVREYP